MRRLLWFTAGATASLWAARRVRSTVERYEPGRVADGLGDALRRALAEGRRGMHEREAELRAQLSPPPSPRALPSHRG